MPCESRRQLEYEKEKEEARKRKKKREEDLKKRKQLEKERRQKAIMTVEQKARQLGWVLGKVGAGKYRITKPYSTDLMEMEILHDGRIKVNTPGKISMPNHKSADAFLDGIAKALKGKWNILTRHFHGATEGAVHTHTH
jgi:hypothetical protein